MIHRTLQQRAEYHLRRRGSTPRCPGQTVMFRDTNGDLAEGEFWAFAPQNGLWLTVNGVFVRTRVAAKRRLFAGEWVQVP